MDENVINSEKEIIRALIFFILICVIAFITVSGDGNVAIPQVKIWAFVFLASDL